MQSRALHVSMPPLEVCMCSLVRLFEHTHKHRTLTSVCLHSCQPTASPSSTHHRVLAASRQSCTTARYPTMQISPQQTPTWLHTHIFCIHTSLTTVGPVLLTGLTPSCVPYAPSPLQTEKNYHNVFPFRTPAQGTGTIIFECLLKLGPANTGAFGNCKPHDIRFDCVLLWCRTLLMAQRS